MRLCQLGSWRAAVGLAVLSQQPGNHTLAIGAGGGQTTVPDGEAGTGCPQAAPSCSRASNPSGTSDLPWGGWPGAATVRLVSEVHSCWGDGVEAGLSRLRSRVCTGSPVVAKDADVSLPRSHVVFWATGFLHGATWRGFPANPGRHSLFPS